MRPTPTQATSPKNVSTIEDYANRSVTMATNSQTQRSYISAFRKKGSTPVQTMTPLAQRSIMDQSDFSNLLSDEKVLPQTFTDLTSYKKTQPQSIAAHELCKNMQDEVNIECLPRSIYISSRKDDRSLVKLKNDFRKNVFDHKNFD